MSLEEKISDIHVRGMQTIPFSHFGVRLAAESSGGKPDQNVIKFGGDCNFQALQMRNMIQSEVRVDGLRVLSSRYHSFLEVDADSSFWYPEITYPLVRPGRVNTQNNFEDIIENIPSGRPVRHTQVIKRESMVRLGPLGKTEVHAPRLDYDYRTEYPYSQILDRARQDMCMNIVTPDNVLLSILWQDYQFMAQNRSTGEIFHELSEEKKYREVLLQIAKQCGGTRSELEDYLHAAADARPC